MYKLRWNEMSENRNQNHFIESIIFCCNIILGVTTYPHVNIYRNRIHSLLAWQRQIRITLTSTSVSTTSVLYFSHHSPLKGCEAFISSNQVTNNVESNSFISIAFFHYFLISSLILNSVMMASQQRQTTWWSPKPFQTRTALFSVYKGLFSFLIEMKNSWWKDIGLPSKIYCKRVSFVMLWLGTFNARTKEKLK